MPRAEPKGYNRLGSLKAMDRKGKAEAGPKASLAENDMESAINENAFAILNYRSPFMNIDATS